MYHVQVVPDVTPKLQTSAEKKMLIISWDLFYGRKVGEKETTAEKTTARKIMSLTLPSSGNTNHCNGFV